MLAWLAIAIPVLEGSIALAGRSRRLWRKAAAHWRQRRARREAAERRRRREAAGCRGLSAWIAEMERQRPSYSERYWRRIG